MRPRLISTLQLVLKVATTADSLAAATEVRAQHVMHGHTAHADWALLLRRQVGKRPKILLGSDIELASSFIQLLLDAPALDLMLLAVLVLAFLVAIPNALAPVALFEGITFRTASRAALGRGLALLAFGLVAAIGHGGRRADAGGQQQGSGGSHVGASNGIGGGPALGLPALGLPALGLLAHGSVVAVGGIVIQRAHLCKMLLIIFALLLPGILAFPAIFLRRLLASAADATQSLGVSLQSAIIRCPPPQTKAELIMPQYSYYDIDTILAEEELVPCTTLLQCRHLAHLDPDYLTHSAVQPQDDERHDYSADAAAGKRQRGGTSAKKAAASSQRSRAGSSVARHLPESSRIKMPLWSVDKWSHLGFVRLGLPRHFGRGARERLQADPSVADLRYVCGGFEFRLACSFVFLRIFEPAVVCQLFIVKRFE